MHNTHPHADNRSRIFEKPFLLITVALGMISFAIFLAYHNIADGDIWSRLVQGSSVWYDGKLMVKDIFSFTPSLPRYVDHEWGSGLIFFILLKMLGPASLLYFKILTALGALCFAVAAGRISKTSWPALLLIAIPAGFTIFPGYVPVVRCHAFTYLFFAAALFLLELIRRGRVWPAAAIVLIMAVWANVHAGFAIGLAAVGIYTLASVVTRNKSLFMLTMTLATALATLINPYGIELWNYLFRALGHIPKNVNEWLPMHMGGLDSFLGFRLLFIIAVFLIAAGWAKAKGTKLDLPGLLLLVLTAYMTFRSRRHAPLFGICCAAYLGPYLEAVLKVNKKNKDRGSYVHSLRSHSVLLGMADITEDGVSGSGACRFLSCPRSGYTHAR